ncbi:hypothetical protein N9A94_01180 [Akkermansiaceae bacterium]|nr:hypothetical protein [Akkermansiaceae bacterium]MDB4537067.1 hypothetical protein [Akkermansiaceae bacterium]MDB4544629.1 hypothetical protein [Akkermansiaceae bacterium]
MGKNHPPNKVWKAAEVSFIEVELRHPTDRQLRIEFNCGVRLVIADDSQFPLASKLIHFIRRSEETSP